MMNLREEIEKYCIANPQKEYEKLTEKFLAYWEKEIKGEPRWMREKTWKLGARLATWSKNNKTHANNKLTKTFRELANKINLYR